MLAAALVPLHANAAWESTAHGAQSSIGYYLSDYTGGWPPDAPSGPPDSEGVGDSATGTFGAHVPTGFVASTYGGSRLSADASRVALEAAYGRRWEPGENYDNIQASTRCWDTWTVSGGTGAGVLQLTLKYDSRYEWGDGILAGTLSQTTADGQTHGLWSAYTGSIYFDPPSGTVHINVPFEYGQAFQIAGGIEGENWAHWSDGDSRFGTTQDMTVEITSVQLARGDLLQVASGNATYVYNVTHAVPEPGTWALLLAGVPVLAWASRRRGAARRSV